MADPLAEAYGVLVDRLRNAPLDDLQATIELELIVLGMMAEVVGETGLGGDLNDTAGVQLGRFIERSHGLPAMGVSFTLPIGLPKEQ